MITRLVWTIWTLMSAVPKKAVKLNHSPPLSQCHGCWCLGSLCCEVKFFPLFVYSGYPTELSNALKGQLDISALQDLEDSMCRPFHNPDPNRNWREGVSKTSMNYLLLDPRITRNLPNRVKTIGNCESSLNPLHTGRCGSNFKVWYSNS